MSCDRIVLAAPRSFCAGVEMAIKALAWMVRMFDPPVYCYHEIVHNQVVVDRFRRAGVVFVDDVEDVPPGAPLMLSAHGSAPEVVKAARARTRLVVDAVCPLVRKVHHELRHRADTGHAVVYAGHATHDEAVGTVAVAPGATRLIEGPADVAGLDVADRPVAFLAQTTLAVEAWEDALDAVRQRFGDVWVPDRSDLCFATTNRQAAVRAIAPRCDAVVVIGSASSSNTLALAEVARATVRSNRTPVVVVDGPDELDDLADGLDGLAGTVGVTAGASAPEDLVQGVLSRLDPRDGIEVVDVTTEDEYFPPPRELRELARWVGAGPVVDGDRSVAASDVLRDLPDRTSPPPAARGADAAAIARQQLGAYSERVDHEMAEVVEREVGDPWLRAAIGYHLGWLDEPDPPHRVPETATAGLGNAISGSAGGKKLRATLAVLAYRAAAATATAAPVPVPPADDLDRVVPLAAAVELFHNWTLVHDDIEDGDRMRRGRPALWTVCGVAQAINVGDAIHALTGRCLARLGDRGVAGSQVADLLSEMARTGVELTAGQARDLAFEQTTDIDRHRYLEMVGGKTAALMRYATYGGAVLGSGDTRAFAEFGRRLGLAFQIRDDVLGIWGTDAETGKPTGSDIRRRKKSLPIVLALERTTGPDRRRLEALYAQDAPLTSADERFVREVLERCGARELAQACARRHRDEAVAALERAAGGEGRPAARPHLVALRALADFVTERSH